MREMRQYKMSRMVLLILSLVAFCHTAAGQFKVFDVVGDSVSWGVNPDETGVAAGWVQMLFGEYGDHAIIEQLFPGIETNNSAVGGATAVDWASTGYAPMDALLARQPDLVAVMIGANDYFNYLVDGEMTAAEFEELRQNIRTIIDRLQALTPRPQILLLNYYDFLDGFSANLPLPFSIFYSGFSEDVVTGNQLIAEVVQEKGCILVDGIYGDFLHHCYGFELGDTGHLDPYYMNMPLANFDIHPVTAGHEAIYRNVYDALWRLADSYRTSVSKSWWLYK